MPDPNLVDCAPETVQVVQETARIEKHVVETGRTLIHKTVSEREAVIDALLERSDVTVERIPVGRVVAEAPAPRQEGDEWIIPVLEERIVVEKQLVLKEELRVRTVRSHEPVQRRVRLLEEHVTVEAEGSQAATSKGDEIP